ncbi:ATP-binding protein, partial [Pseudomonas syringae pv. tagetis]
TCWRCSRVGRGTLYTFAYEIGATKMALGHNRDDIVETFFLNMFFNGSLKAMPPNLRADDGRNVVIRPLAYCHEKDIQ